ncbi:hypothetical protein BDA96_05G206300 [Sorghum bicolor]|uniref:Knottin scorpion toxin-like domain-containing protein n=2 Tax=Sorghum bicolor TaxID=4558 RepID=A0A921QYQ5_SORBI|nr:hypothetical protein BDA96_05G206300 [Sorghum bicolor]KXG28960.1 hypothetical protein SORBI_3005G189800 [Sorghum bicolor]
MASKMIITAAAAALILSFLLPSEVVGRGHAGKCRAWRNQVPECRTLISCIRRCQDEGNKTGFCDSNKICMCTSCSDDELQVGQRSSSLLPPAPEPTGA